LDAEFADESEARAFLIADNRTAELGWTDDALLVAQLEALDDRQGTGYSDDDLGELYAQLAALERLENPRDPDEVPPVPVEAVSKPGEVYELGEHRLMCGDATRDSDMAALVDDAQISCVFADPPYGLAGYGLAAASECVYRTSFTRRGSRVRLRTLGFSVARCGLER
jgi:site-specific DNA-methyltransferase (adenine-specific)